MSILSGSRRLALAALAILACGGIAAAAAADTPTEWIDPAYTVYLPPGGIFGLSPNEDRYEIEITRREAIPALTAVHLTLLIAHEGTSLLERERTFPVTAGAHALVREPQVVPVWQTIRRGRLVGLWHAWEYDGFTLEAVIRENGAGGRVIYSIRMANRVLGISRRGFFDRYGAPITLTGIMLALFASLLAARRVPAGPGRRARLVFDLAALAAVAVAALAFSRYALLAVWPVAALPALVPGRRKESAAVRVASTLRAGWEALEPRRPATWAPALAVFVVATWLLSWHQSLLLALGFLPVDFSEHLKLLSALYLALALSTVLPIHLALGRRAARSRSLRLPVALAAGAIIVWVAARAVDWGTFFYSAGHIDEDFWAHAFYGQTLTILRERPALALALAAAGSAALLLGLLFQAVRFARRAAARPGGPALAPLLWVNAAIGAAAFIVLECCRPLFSPAAGREISDSIREAFSGVPEVKVGSSLARTLLRREPGKPPPLDRAFLEKLERAGLRLGGLDPVYPLMKPSIYLDPARAAAPAGPRVPPGTNLIVILGESLSAALADERAHGIAGLTPHIDDFRARSYTFRNLYSADFPTIKGELAALASFAFDHRGLPITADAGNPLKSRFLFLSDVLVRQRGYTAYHLQSDYASFAGTARILGRHSYERIYSAEDPELRRRARRPIVKTWGLYDEDLFRAISELLEEGAFRAPFLLTVATTDLHFPYATLQRHPGTHGNALLDAVHSEDAAFGVFWEAFKRSPRAADTLVLLTADHALVRRVVRRGGADPRQSEFDYLLGALYVPGDPRWAGGGTDATCTQLDLLPTLLDVLGVDTPNPFLGLSIFVDRPGHPLALAREIPSERWSPAERSAALAIGWTPADHRRFLDLLRYLALANRVLPPEPLSAR